MKILHNASLHKCDELSEQTNAKLTKALLLLKLSRTDVIKHRNLNTKVFIYLPNNVSHETFKYSTVWIPWYVDFRQWITIYRKLLIAQGLLMSHTGAARQFDQRRGNLFIHIHASCNLVWTKRECSLFDHL